MTRETKAFTKAEVLQKLAIQAYILTLWEKKAQVTPFSAHGEILYSESDVQKLGALKELLYEKGYTLDAAIGFLEQNSYEDSLPQAPVASFEPATRLQENSSAKTPHKELTEKLQTLRSKLLSLRELL